MNTKTWIPLGLAVVLGVVAMFIAKDMMAKKDNQSQAVGNLTSIVVAKGSIPPGHALKAEDLAMGEVAAASVPEGAFTNLQQAVGRTTLLSLGARQPVLNTVLAADGAGTGLQALVPPNMRAITIEVNEFTGLAGMIIPGVTVDVVTTVQGEDNAGLASRTIVQNVKVLAVGQRVSQETPVARDGTPEPFRNITLLVKPEEAEAVQLATQTGRPWLLLRSGKDKEIINSNGVTISDLRGKGARKTEKDPFAFPVNNLTSKLPNLSAPATQPSGERRIKIIRGGQESEISVPATNAPAGKDGLMTRSSESVD